MEQDPHFARNLDIAGTHPLDGAEDVARRPVVAAPLHQPGQAARGFAKSHELSLEPGGAILTGIGVGHEGISG
ncbi:hypothetical protein JMJ56_10620 [Belnapia sp. T18]|uniref:Uncharacterized protein n=1 Tax=Belnapia arida TaxID=2804533 RepID=A0ABS1U2R2_9PROT|nr:hypothetical protein [Belnapia arida]MBL6078460.1 hypothetical protein [Belnapia arida]